MHNTIYIPIVKRFLPNTFQNNSELTEFESSIFCCCCCGCFFLYVSMLLRKRCPEFVIVDYIWAIFSLANYGKSQISLYYINMIIVAFSEKSNFCCQIFCHRLIIDTQKRIWKKTEQNESNTQRTYSLKKKKISEKWPNFFFPFLWHTFLGYLDQIESKIQRKKK